VRDRRPARTRASRGAGTTAQRLLVEHLFTTTTTHRIWALTAADNAPERRSLTKCRFRQEGVLCEAGFRGGCRADVVVHAVLRGDVSQEAG
jgi:RimJ/RimL family protein N-acetyltransferase